MYSFSLALTNYVTHANVALCPIKTSFTDRLQNFDDDSDDAEYERKLSIRQVSDRRTNRMRANEPNSAEDSHDENDSSLPAGNLLNADKDSLSGSKSDNKPVIRGGPARRVNSKPAAANIDTDPARGFVPRDLSSKLKRNTSTSTANRNDDDHSSRNSNANDNDEGDTGEPAPWTKVPKKFLSEPAAAELPANNSTRYDSSKLPMPNRARSESQNSNTNRSSFESNKESKTFSKPVAKALATFPKLLRPSNVN